MNILLLGDFSGNEDEGLKNIAKNLQRSLAAQHAVRTFNVKGILRRAEYDRVRDFTPDIIHYVSSPTLSAFITLILASRRWRNAKTVISALHPRYSSLLRSDRTRAILAPVIRTDAVFCQDESRVFRALGKQCFFVPNGVNVTRFCPPAPGEKAQLRRKYGIGEGDFVALHVGHLSRVRNLQFFSRLRRACPECRVVIIGGTYVYRDTALLEELQAAGCTVITGYLDHIEDLYKLADCYVFPVPHGNTIHMPLSVLEAMAANLPVASLDYPCLRRLGEGEGMYFSGTADGLITAVQEWYRAQADPSPCRNRERVLPYAWERLADRITTLYHSMNGRAI
jgi:glycosyltransferase involved in cell wall biosynthesis